MTGFSGSEPSKYTWRGVMRFPLALCTYMAPMNCAQTEEAETTLGTGTHVSLYIVLTYTP